MTSSYYKSPELFKNKINSIGDLTLDFILQKHQFRIDSKEDYPFSLNASNKTQSVGGFQFTEGGRAFIQTDESLVECVGRIIDPRSKSIPAKITRAENGDIVLWAVNGDIILDANSIQIRASDPNGGYIYLNATKLIQAYSPTISHEGEYCRITANGEVCIAGSSVNSHGEIAHDTTLATDEAKSSLLGKILSFIKTIKKFFNSTCSEK